MEQVTALQSFNAASVPGVESLPRYCSVGIHPWSAGEMDIERALQRMRIWAEHAHCIAFGEAGLDRLRGPDLAHQEVVLIRQLRLAEELRMPMILHNVRCTSELLRLRLIFNSTPWILHGFQGNAEVAAQCVEKNMHLSFGPGILRNTSRLAEVLSAVSLERVFCESDDSGTDVQEVYSAVECVTGCSESDLRERIWDNFIHLFGVRP